MSYVFLVKKIVEEALLINYSLSFEIGRAHV